MRRYAKPEKQFDFLTQPIKKLTNTQRALLRRVDYRGSYFNDIAGAQPKSVAQAIAEGITDDSQDETLTYTIPEIEVAWEDAEGLEISGPTYLTFTMDGQDLLKFKVTDDHHFMLYSNTRNLIDVVGKLEKE